MPRQAREKSESGYYHILLRGIGQQNIFEEDEDREKFLQILGKYKEELKFKIAAYCLMSNHVHLLIEDVNRNLELMMKKIAGSYAYYFNWKYERVGHVFQDRFKSEPVDSDEYLLTVVRYIHQNPFKAGITKGDKYPWSSYNAYVHKTNFVDTEQVLLLLNGKEGFVEFMDTEDESSCLEIVEAFRLTDEKATKIIRKIAKVKNVQAIQNFDSAKRNEVLHILKEQGISIRQLSRLTGINRGVVLRA